MYIFFRKEYLYGKHNNTFNAPDTGKTVNVRMLKIARNGGPNIRYGLNLPHLVLVLSAILPIIGSLIASQTLAINMIIEIAPADKVTTSV